MHHWCRWGGRGTWNLLVDFELGRLHRVFLNFDHPDNFRLSPILSGHISDILRGRLIRREGVILV